MRSLTMLMVLAVCMFAATVVSAPAGQVELSDRVITIVREYYPDAEIANDDGNLMAKYKTMVFTVHGCLMTGEYLEKTDKIEGPNKGGFMLSISVKSGEYKGQLGVPDTLRKPYWQTYTDRPPTEDGKGYYDIHFSYGSGIDPDFMKALLQVLPKTERPERESN